MRVIVNDTGNCYPVSLNGVYQMTLQPDFAIVIPDEIGGRIGTGGLPIMDYIPEGFETFYMTPKGKKPGLKKAQLPYPIDFYAGERHFIDHMVAIYRGYPNKGRFYVQGPLKEYCDEIGFHEAESIGKRFAEMPPGRGPVMVASIADVNRMKEWDRPIILIEHGAGCSFSNEHPSHPGGRAERDLVDCFINPNEWAAKRDREAHPKANIITEGCPKLDWVFKKRFTWSAKDPVVCFSTHWHSNMVCELNWIWPYYKDILPALKEKYPNMIGHAHPRAWKKCEREYKKLGIEPVRDFKDVLNRADLYAAAMSSTQFEFAATGKPVVCITCEAHRPNVNHGHMFWEALPGALCRNARDLIPLIDEALLDPEYLHDKRVDSVQQVYTVTDGTSSKRIIQALMEWQGI